jgi:hypothetical protein
MDDRIAIDAGLLLWPDFSKTPATRRPVIRYLDLTPEKTAVVSGYEVKAIAVHHTVDCL